MRDNKNEYFPEVTPDGEVIGRITRGEAHSGTKRLHPVVHLHLFNSKGELYLQHRPTWKDIQPDRWDTSCGGHVDYGETITQALEREVSEELGISGIKMRHLEDYIFESARERELVHIYTAVYDGVVTPNAEELNGGRFFSISEIESRIGTGFLTPNFESEYQTIVKKYIRCQP